VVDSLYCCSDIQETKLMYPMSAVFPGQKHAYQLCVEFLKSDAIEIVEEAGENQVQFGYRSLMQRCCAKKRTSHRLNHTNL
jgi:hypothetical protein